MRSLIYAYGSRGDVEPAVALAQAMKRSGDEAVVAVPQSLVARVSAMGVSTAGISDVVLQKLSGPDARAMFEGSVTRGERRRISMMLMRESANEYGRILSDIASAATDFGQLDAIVHTQGLAEATHQMGEWLGVPTVLATLYPNYARSGSYPSMLLAGARFTNSMLNRASHDFANLVAPPRLFRGQLLDWRTEHLGLEPRKGYWNFRRDSSSSPRKILHAFSTTLVRPSREWGESVSTRGFWFAEQNGYRPAEGLTNFMAAHHPVVVSLGSQRPSDEAGSNQTILEVAQELGVPLLVVKGTSEFSVDQSARVRVVDDVPFQWLLPRARAVVHAGGAGVAHHALAAGVPQVALPIHGEQLMWSERLAEQGVSPAPVMMRQLTRVKFRAALSDALGSARIARSVKACALAIRGEDGVDGAVRDLTDWVNDSRGR